MKLMTAAFCKRLIQAFGKCPSNVPARLLPDGPRVIFGLKKDMQPDGLSPTRIGCLSSTVLEAKSAAVRRGNELEILLLDANREVIQPFRQSSLFPTRRLMICAVGKDAACTLEAVAAIERSWDLAETRFDPDGVPIGP